MYKSLFMLCLAAVASALPSPRMAIQDNQLSEILNKTICPMTVKLDVQETRIPKTIKYVLCAKPSHDVCEGAYAHVACCDKRDSCKYTFRCEQLEDRMKVGNIHDDSLMSLSVPIGCSLVMLPRNLAQEQH